LYLLNGISNFYSFHIICKLTHHHLVSDFTIKPTFFMSSFPRGLQSLHGVFGDIACMARWQSQPVGKLSVDVCWSKPRSLDRLEQQNWVTFATILLEFLRKRVKFVSSRLRKCVLNWWGLCWNFTFYGNVWSLKWCKNCSNIAVCLGDVAVQHCVLTVQSPSTHKWENFFFVLFFLCVLEHFDVICWMKHRK
jgi:hypothetical protein